MTVKIEAIIEKIRKLFAKANDASVTEAEAMLYAQKAQEMLAEHNLDMTAVSSSDNEHVVIEREIYNTPYGNVLWRGTLANIVAEMYFCVAYKKTQWTYNKSGNKKPDSVFVFVGKSHNRAVAISMYAYLEKTIVRLSKEYSKVPLERYHFEKGAGLRLAARIRQQTKSMRENVTSVPEPASTNPGNLPALYKTELALVNDFLADMDMKKAKTKSVSFNKATRDGAEAANNISLRTERSFLNNQIDGNNVSKFLLT